MNGSPDRMDAFIYANIDTSPLLENPYRDLQKGDVVRATPWELLGLARTGAGMPI